MQIIVVGCGRIGASLATALATRKHDVVVVDRNTAAFSELGPLFNGVTVTGDGIDVDVLRRADIAKARALVAVTNDDSVNIMAAQVAQAVFGVPRVIGRINSPHGEQIFRDFGIETISPAHLTVLNLLLTLETEGVHIRESFGEVFLAQVHISYHMAGQTLAQIEQPCKLRVAAVDRRGHNLIPDESYISQAGDLLIATLRRDALLALREALKPPGRR